MAEASWPGRARAPGNMAGAEVSNGLREALIENLNNILSPQADVRRAAEEQIHVLEVTEGEIKEGGGGESEKENPPLFLTCDNNMVHSKEILNRVEPGFALCFSPAPFGERAGRGQGKGI